MKRSAGDIDVAEAEDGAVGAAVEGEATKDKGRARTAKRKRTRGSSCACRN